MSLQNENPYLDALLIRRLQGMSGSPQDASLSFDFASGLDYGQASSLDQTGVTTYAHQNGASEYLNSWVSQQAPLMAVDDVMSYQERLRHLGYLPQNYVPSGQWDGVSQSAAYELNQHASDAFKQGNGNPLSISAKHGFDLLNATMPSKVFQGIVGAVEGMGKSFASTFSHIKKAAILTAEGHFGNAFHQFKWDDALNFLTVASMFIGVGDVVAAGRSLLGAAELGGDVLANIAAKPVAEDLASLAAQQGPSLASKIVGGVVRRFSSGAADNYLDWVAQNGFRAQAQRPLLKVAANVYGGLSKAAFFPQAQAILLPDSEMGKAVKKAPSLPSAVDWSTLVLHPEVGLTPFKSFAHVFTPLSAGIMDFTRLAGIKEPVDSVSRISMATQAFIHSEAARKIAGDEKALQGGAYKIRAFERAIGNEKGKAIIEAADGTRSLNPEYAQKAIDWSSHNPHDAAAFIKSLQTSAQAREGLGLTGFNPEPAYRHAENVANELTSSVHAAKPELLQLKTEIAAADEKVKQLQDLAETGDVEAFKQLQDARQVQSDLHAKASHSVDFGSFAHDAELSKKLESGDLRVLPQRWDNPRTKQTVGQLMADWEQATDEGSKEAVRRQVRAMGLSDVSDADMAEHLKVLHELSPYDLSGALPDGYTEELASHGYKPVAGGDAVVLRSDINPASVHLPDYSNLSYWWASLGLSAKKISPEAVGRMVHATTSQAWDEVMTARGFKPGTGEAILGDVHSILADQRRAISQQGVTEGPFQRMLSRTRLAVQDVTVSRLSKILKTRWIDDPKLAKSVARDLTRAAKDANFHPGILNSPTHALGVLDEVGAALRIHGLPGLMEGLRSMTLSDVGKINLGAIGGGLAGYEAGQQEGATNKETIAQTLGGAAIGGILGGKVPIGRIRPLAKFADSNWGFLPDNLLRASLALRFTFNPLFEAKLLAKQQIIRGAGYNLSPSLMPLRAMESAGKTLDYSKIFAEATGASHALDDSERLMTNAGIFGYNVRNHATYDYGRLYDRMVAGGKSHEEAIQYLRDNGQKLISYGPRSPLEKSVNAIFFPFSFEKKYVGILHDYFTAQPVRTLLVHHALKFADDLDNADSGTQTKWAELIKRHAPILKEITKLNAFSSGLSGGELGGVFKPLAQTLGVTAGAVAGAFLPVAVSEDKTKQFSKLVPRLVPAWNEIANAKDELLQTVRGVHGITKEASIDDYFAAKQGAATNYAQLGMAFGTDGTIESFERSSQVPDFLKAQWLEKKTEIQQRFPDGAQAEAEAANKSAIRQTDLIQMLSKVLLTPEEKAIGAVVQQETLAASVNALGASLPGDKVMQQQMKTASVRATAMQVLQKYGRKFNDLWVRYGFEREYGPLVSPVEAAA